MKILKLNLTNLKLSKQLLFGILVGFLVCVPIIVYVIYSNQITTTQSSENTQIVSKNEDIIIQEKSDDAIEEPGQQVTTNPNKTTSNISQPINTPSDTTNTDIPQPNPSSPIDSNQQQPTVQPTQYFTNGCTYVDGIKSGSDCPINPPNNYYLATKGCYAIGYGAYIQCPEYNYVYNITAESVCNGSYCKGYCKYYYKDSNSLISTKTIEMPTSNLQNINCSV